MKRSRLTEGMTFKLVTAGVEHAGVLDALCSQWGGVPCCELATLLSFTRALALVEQTCHWQASGDPFYGDHLLFERIYNDTVSEIDTVAEKTVGLCGSALVNPLIGAHQVAEIVKLLYGAGAHVPNTNDLVTRMHAAELHFIKVVELVAEKMNASSMGTLGCDNMLAGIADKHEEHVYLLKQRLSA